jgi:hypothetical protein
MIFTLDSLGSKHGAAINNLGRYLQLEAADKRKLPLEESTRADGHWSQLNRTSVTAGSTCSSSCASFSRTPRGSGNAWSVHDYFF